MLDRHADSQVPAKVARQLARKRPRQVRPPSRRYEPRDGIKGNLTRCGVAGRVWLGSAGTSDLIAGKLVIGGPVEASDQEEVTRELSRRLVVEIAREIHQRTGLEISSDPGNAPLSHLEWLVLLSPDQENETRLQAFCEGYSSYLPPGVSARNLSPMQVQELGRRLMARLPSRSRNPQDPPDPPV